MELDLQPISLFPPPADGVIPDGTTGTFRVAPWPNPTEFSASLIKPDGSFLCHVAGKVLAPKGRKPAQSRNVAVRLAYEYLIETGSTVSEAKNAIVEKMHFSHERSVNRVLEKTKELAESTNLRFIDRKKGCVIMQARPLHREEERRLAEVPAWAWQAWERQAFSGVLRYFFSESGEIEGVTMTGPVGWWREC